MEKQMRSLGNVWEELLPGKANNLGQPQVVPSLSIARVPRFKLSHWCGNNQNAIVRHSGAVIETLDEIPMPYIQCCISLGVPRKSVVIDLEC